MKKSDSKIYKFQLKKENIEIKKSRKVYLNIRESKHNPEFSTKNLKLKGNL